MSRPWRLSLLVAVLLAAGLTYLAWTNPVIRNLPRAIAYERTLDRYAQIDETRIEVTTARDSSSRQASLLGALFGRDDDLPHLFGLVACKGAGGKDGMPVLFSHEIDLATLEPGDIAITTTSGKKADITCLTMAPADDPGELRTALLIGQFGSPDDQPALIEITGNVLSKDHQVNFKGTRVVPARLEAGPSLVWAEIVPKTTWTLGRAATALPWGGGDGCPVDTQQIVRVTWNGGVTPVTATPVVGLAPSLYKVTVRKPDGSLAEVMPFALADQGDGDNNHQLCLRTHDPATQIRFPAGHVTDPRGDMNEATSVVITRPA